MPAPPADLPIDQLLASRPDLWRGRRRPIMPVLGSGRADLDHWLPAGGWPCGRLIELLPEHFGLGELDMLLPALAEQTRQGLPVLFASPPLVPCPQYLAQAGLALERLIIVRKTDQALWAAEQGLKSGLCGAVVLWHPPGPVQPRAIRRLQLAAENGSAPVFVCYRAGQQPPPSLAALRMQIRPGPELIMLRGNCDDNRCDNRCDNRRDNRRDNRDRHGLHLGRGNVIAFRPTGGKNRQ